VEFDRPSVSFADKKGVLIVKVREKPEAQKPAKRIKIKVA
jgi:hypothetical protein